MLDTILVIIRFAIDILVNFCFLSILNKHFKNIEEDISIGWFVAVAFFASLAGFLLQPYYPLNTVVVVLILFLFTKYKLNVSYGVIIFSFIILVSIFLFSELLAVYILRNVLNIPTPLLFEIPRYKSYAVLSTTVFSLFCLFCSDVIIKYCKNLGKYHFKITKKHIIIFIKILCFTFVPQVLLITINRYNYSLSFLFLNVVQIIISTFLIFAYVISLTEKDKLQEDCTKLEMDNQNMNGMVDGVRSIKHDYNNIFQTMNGYMRNKQYDNLDRYIKELMKECQFLNNLSILKKDLFDDAGVYGVVASKHYIAMQDGILFEIENSISFSHLKFPAYDFTRVLGILLDNALEATKRCDNKFVRFEAKYEPKKGASIIRILNTYDTSIKIDLEEIFKKGVSSKQVKSGLGLWEVRKIIKKYSNTQIYTTLENGMFIQNVVVE